MDEKSKLYNQLYKAVKECNTDRNSEVWLQKTMEIWRKEKQEAKGNMTKLKTEIGVIIDNLNSDKFRKRACLLKYFAKSTDRKRSTSNSDCSSGLYKRSVLRRLLISQLPLHSANGAGGKIYLLRVKTYLTPYGKQETGVENYSASTD